MQTNRTWEITIISASLELLHICQSQESEIVFFFLYACHEP